MNSAHKCGRATDVILLLILICVWQHDGDVDRACDQLRSHIKRLNNANYRTVSGHLEQAIVNVVANARYRFVAKEGPQLGQVSINQPLMWTYFLELAKTTETLEEAEKVLEDPECARFVMAHNGWVMNDDPLRNFAEAGSNVYLRRELIVW